MTKKESEKNYGLNPSHSKLERNDTRVTGDSEESPLATISLMSPFPMWFHEAVEPPYTKSARPVASRMSSRIRRWSCFLSHDAQMEQVWFAGAVAVMFIVNRL